MASFAPPASFVKPAVPSTTPAQTFTAPEHRGPGPAAKAAEEIAAMRRAEVSAKVLPNQLVVEVDAEAGRFVQTVIDSQTEEVQLRYPNETQLAFSRAVTAYERAIKES